jgi:hypothetical protein
MIYCVVDPDPHDPHQIERWDPDPHPHQSDQLNPDGIKVIG